MNEKIRSDVEVRLAIPSDCGAIWALFSRYFASKHTSRDSASAQRLERELAGLVDGTSIIMVAVREGEIVGAAIATQDRDFSRYESDRSRKTGYLSKNVVHEDHRGEGIGRALVGARLRELKKREVEVIYSSHHADNIPSAKALDAFGFDYVDTYLDPEKRPTGSRMTAVRRLVVELDEGEGS